jgi:uncharacterized HAD superfamily protein
MKRVAIVDIDATLWALDPPWWDELKKIHPECPQPGTNGDWDFFLSHMTIEEALKAAKAVHMEQYKYKPFAHASAMVRFLRSEGWYVIIASHRHEDTCGATVRWLSQNNIPFDDLFIAEKGKETLFDKYEVMLFIDDSPKSIQKALDKGINCFTIKYSYNQHFNPNEVFFASDDAELYIKVKEFVNADNKLTEMGL